MPSPMRRFEDTPFYDSFKRIFTKEGYSEPTSIQAVSWPIALTGRDLISVARTGSGKTCGYLLPAFASILKKKESEGGTFTSARDGGRPSLRRQANRGGTSPSMVVLAPTRELVVQIEKEAKKYSIGKINVVSLFGGVSKGPQIKELRDGVDIVVATPGRCNDLIEMGALNLSKVNYFVLDEADRMLDMGFEPQIQTISDQIPAARQSLFFTATWPAEVQSLANEYLNNPAKIKIGSSNQLIANTAITQNVHVVQGFQKKEKLVEILENLEAEQNGEGKKQFPKTIIFVGRKNECDDLKEELIGDGHYAAALHGDVSQERRNITMDKFRQGRFRIMVATDVAARGLDVKDVEVVINYDFPIGSSGVEDYVHRIGRTGRGNASGVAHTLFTRADAGSAKKLVQVMEKSGQEVPDELRAFVKSNFSPRSSKFSKGGFSSTKSRGADKFGESSQSRPRDRGEYAVNPRGSRSRSSDSFGDDSGSSRGGRGRASKYGGDDDYPAKRGRGRREFGRDDFDY